MDTRKIGEWTPRQLTAFINRVILEAVPENTGSFDEVAVADMLSVDDQLSLSTQAAQYVGEVFKTPSVRLYLNGVGAVAATTWTDITWDTQSHETTLGRMWTSGASVTIPFDGLYLVTAFVGWAALVGGGAAIRITGNWGTSQYYAASLASGVTPGNGPLLVEQLRFSTNDTIKVQVYHSAGATPTADQNHFAVSRIG
jgi:hypothetical protein